MPLQFQYESEFTERQTIFKFTVPNTVNPRSLDILITPLYVSVTVRPTHVTLIDLNEEVDLEQYTCKYKKGILTITLNNEKKNGIYKAPDEELIRRRNDSFFKYQEYTHEKQEKQRQAEAKAKHDADMADMERKLQDRERMRQKKEQDMEDIRKQLHDEEKMMSQTQQTGIQEIPAVRSA